MNKNVEIKLRTDLKLGLVGMRTVIPVENMDKDGVLLVRIQYLVGGNWEESTIARALLQDLANAQAERAALRPRNEALLDELIALRAEVAELRALEDLTLSRIADDMRKPGIGSAKQ